MATLPRRAALVELRAERDRRRITGKHLDTASAVLVYHLRAVLYHHGWLHRAWLPIPNNAATLPGRRWGSSGTGWNARLRIHLPDELSETLRRAAYWSSLPATRKLQYLAAEYPHRMPPRVRVGRDLLREALDRDTGELVPCLAPGSPDRLLLMLSRIATDDTTTLVGQATCISG